jgi:hypothetical protein
MWSLRLEDLETCSRSCGEQVNLTPERSKSKVRGRKRKRKGKEEILLEALGSFSFPTSNQKPNPVHLVS